MVRLTKWLRRLFIVCLLLALLVTYAWSYWQDLKQQFGLEVSWQGVGISLQGVTFKQLVVNQTATDGSYTHVNGQNITLSWSNLTIKQLAIRWQAGDLVASAPATPTPQAINTPQLLSNLSWLPYHIEVDDLIITLPCATGQCKSQGQLVVVQHKQSNLPLSLRMLLHHEDQQLAIEANLYQQAQQLDLQLTADLNNQPLVKLSTQMEALQLSDWRGELTVFKLNNVQGLFNWLQEWLPTQQPIESIPEAMQLTASWQFHFPKGFAQSKPDQGFLALDALVPNPWPFPKLGYLQGSLKTKLTIKQRPIIEQLEANIKLTSLDKNLLNLLPIDLQPQAITLTTKPLAITDVSQADRALAVNVEMEGKLHVVLSSDIFINTPKAEIQWVNGLLQADTKQLVVDDYQVQNSELSLPFTATIKPKQAAITLDKAALFTVQQLSSQEISAKNLQLALGDFSTTINYANSSPQVTINSPFTLTTTAISHSLLKPVSWQLTGQLVADSEQAKLTGKLTNGAELLVNITAQTDYSKQLLVTAKTPDIFFRSSNVFAETLKDWPELLEIALGKININGSVTIPLDKAAIKANGIIKFSGLTGIYDRSEIRDLSGSATVTLQNNQLKLLLPDLALTEANPGISIGPMQFNGQYTASLNNPTQGILQWSKAEFTLFTGTIWLKSGQLNLAKLPQPLDLQIKNVQLTDILKAYPTEGLNGEGILDGTLPVVITNKGIDVKAGKISARKAGFIKFNSPQIKAVGANNPNMRLVTDALENFQYTLLSSQVSYNQGTAILGLQISGRNPDIQNGQPINLNITLQEDIPALITTLQLTDRVSETIRNRVQKRLQQETSKK